MRNPILVAVVLSLAAIGVTAAHAGGVEAAAAFDQLKSLEGQWKGPLDGEGDEAEAEAEAVGEAVHAFRVSANDSVVMEIMGPDTDQEMINMYHLDGEDLVLTHYCAGGNQPSMRLDRDASTDEKLVFEFTGGTNLDPSTDSHIHSAEITFVDDNRMDSVWAAHQGGEQVGLMTFHLARDE